MWKKEQKMKRIMKFRVRPARLSKVKAKPARYALALIEDIFEKIRPKICRNLTTRLVVNIEFDEVRTQNFVRYNTPAYIAVFGDEE